MVAKDVYVIIMNNTLFTVPAASPTRYSPSSPTATRASPPGFGSDVRTRPGSDRRLARRKS